MKKIIRLTESDLRHIIQNSVKRIIREENDGMILQSIAQEIANSGTMEVNPGENDAEFFLDNGYVAYITFDVECDPFVKKGMKSGSRDVPDDEDEIIDNPTIEIGSIDYCDEDGEQCIQIHDNGVVTQALENVIRVVGYDDYDIPSEEDYFYNEY